MGGRVSNIAVPCAKTGNKYLDEDNEHYRREVLREKVTEFYNTVGPGLIQNNVPVRNDKKK